MLGGNDLAAAVVQLVTAIVAAYGTIRCVRLQRFGSDRRLTVLAWFFGLFAAAVVLQAAWQVQIGWNAPTPFHLPPAGNRTADFDNDTFRPPFDGGPFHPQGSENSNILLAAHHLLMLASLSVGVWAFGHRPAGGAGAAVAAIAPFVLLGELVPAMLALEAGLALYMAARSLINHVERRSPGALQVALGFLLFFIGHLLFFLQHRAGAGRSTIGDILGMVGIVLLIQMLPRTS